MKKLIAIAIFIAVLFANLSSIAMDDNSITVVPIPNPIKLTMFVGVISVGFGAQYAIEYAVNRYRYRNLAPLYTNETIALHRDIQINGFDHTNIQNATRAATYNENGKSVKQWNSTMANTLTGTVVCGALAIGSYYLFNKQMNDFIYRVNSSLLKQHGYGMLLIKT
ncbi:MAG: hypothetical protein WCE21_01015 [Candidatus Babeliales bacterium]